MEKRTIYEEEGLEEEFTESIAKQYNRRKKMGKKKLAAPTAAPKNGVKASKVSKQLLVDAIVNLETQVDKMAGALTLIDDAFRQYLQWNATEDKPVSDFQKHLDATTEKRKAEAEKEKENATDTKSK